MQASRKSWVMTTSDKAQKGIGSVKGGSCERVEPVPDRTATMSGLGQTNSKAP
jgi:hypothetical protein